MADKPKADRDDDKVTVDEVTISAKGRGKAPAAKGHETPATSDQVGPKSPESAARASDARPQQGAGGGDKATEVPTKEAPAPDRGKGKAPAEAEKATLEADALMMEDIQAEQAARDAAEQKNAAKPQKSARRQEKGNVVSMDDARKGKASDKGDKQDAPPPVKGPTKAQLEAELRKQFGIAKSEKPVEPFAPPAEEKVVRLSHDQLHAFKGHTFNVDTESNKYKAFCASVRAHGVNQPVIVRPRDKGGYEIVSGHRRNQASIDAGIADTPCIIRPLTDEQAIQQMVEDNTNNREITTMELARSLQVQLESIKRQGARSALASTDVADKSADAVNKRSNEIVAERNGMTLTQVKRHIQLTKLVPELQEMVDNKHSEDKGKPVLKFTPAVELSMIQPKFQTYIADVVQQTDSLPSLAQAKRLRELDTAKDGSLLNMDLIDGILMEEVKEVEKVVLNSKELSEFLGSDKTPGEMKEIIMGLLKDYAQEQGIKPQERKAELTK